MQNSDIIVPTTVFYIQSMFIVGTHTCYVVIQALICSSVLSNLLRM